MLIAIATKTHFRRRNRCRTQRPIPQSSTRTNGRRPNLSSKRMGRFGRSDQNTATANTTPGITIRRLITKKPGCVEGVIPTRLLNNIITPVSCVQCHDSDANFVKHEDSLLNHGFSEKKGDGSLISTSTKTPVPLADRLADRSTRAECVRHSLTYIAPVPFFVPPTRPPPKYPARRLPCRWP